MGALTSFSLPLLLILSGVWPLSKQAPSLPSSPGKTRLVKTVAELRQVLEKSPRDVTILVADGTYVLTQPLHIENTANVMIRGVSGDPARTIIRGKGFDVGTEKDDLLTIGKAKNLTIAYLTFTETRSYGIKVEAENFPENVQIYHCHFKNIGIRMIKGSTSTQGRAIGGAIRYCRFENTKIPPADWLYEGDYITAIDMMALDNWQISDNLFVNIKGRHGGARGAIFIWVRSKNITVERNAIINCDRGISLGNPSGSTNYVRGQEHLRDSLIRNNIIVPGPDAGIELWWTENIRILNNTIWRVDASGPGLRGGMETWPIKHIEVINNLVRGSNQLSGEVTLRNNLFGTLTGLNLELEAGIFQLSGCVDEAVDQGIPLADIPDDFTGQQRAGTPDLGACEFKKAKLREP
jgi:hypothetical protein